MTLIGVTGGAGFIGERLVRRLALADAGVRSIDIRHESPTSGVMRHADLLDFEQTKAALDGCDTIVHLAGPVVEQVRRQPYQSVDLQVRGTANVLEAARQLNAKRVILASSFYVYSGLPADSVANELTPLQVAQSDLFGASKLMSERMVQAYGDAYGLSTLALRFGSAYGFGRCSNIVQSVLEAGLAGDSFQVWGKGKRRNQYTFVEDVVSGIVAAIDRPEVTGVVNLIDPTVTSTGELGEVFRAEWGFQVMFDTERPDPPSMCYMTSHRAEELLEWTPRPLRVGIRLTYNEAIEERQRLHVQSLAGGVAEA